MSIYAHSCSAAGENSIEIAVYTEGAGAPYLTALIT